MSQSIASVPVGLEQELKRFLRELVQNLDKVLGYRGETKYITDEELANLNLAQLVSRVNKLEEEVNSLEPEEEDETDELDDLKKQIEVLNSLLEAVAIGAAYNDFNASAWSDLRGRSELTAIGSALVNAPFTPVADTNYVIYVDSTKTTVGVWQTITVSSAGVESAWVRTSVGGTWKQMY